MDLNNSQLLDFANDFENLSPDQLARLSNNGGELVSNWHLMYLNGRSGLRKDLEALEKIRDLKNNTSFVNFIDNLSLGNADIPIYNIDDFFGELEGWFNNAADEAYIDVLISMENFVNTMSSSYVNCTNCDYLFNRFIVNDTGT